MLCNSTVGLPDSMNWFTAAMEKPIAVSFFFIFFRRGALQLVNRLEEIVFLGGISPALLEKVMPRIAAAEPDDKVRFGQAERPERVNQQRNQ